MHKLHSQGLLSVAFIDDGYLLRQIVVYCTGKNVEKTLKTFSKLGFVITWWRKVWFWL